MTLNVKASITGTLLTTGDLSELSAKLANALAEISYDQGSGAAQADKVFADTRTLAASTTEDLDLAGSLVGIDGAAFAPAKVKAILVVAAAGNTNDVHVGGDANGLAGLFGAVNDLIVVKPGGVFLWAAPSGGLTVTGGTGDILQVANSGSGTSVTYSIVIIAASA